MSTMEKGKPASHKIKAQSEKSFDLEAEIGKLNIFVPLSELATHDVYRQQIQRSLQMPEVKDGKAHPEWLWNLQQVIWTKFLHHLLDFEQKFSFSLLPHLHSLHILLNMTQLKEALKSLS